jgi:NAD+ diphosphatase
MNCSKFCRNCGASLVLRPTATHARLFCVQCNQTAYDSPVPVVAALVTQGESAILVRNRGWPERMFGLVTGYLEQAEEPADGALREVREELGVEGEVQKLIGAYAYRENNELLIAYHIEVHGTVTLSEELIEYKSVPLSRLKAWPFATGLAVRDWLATRR